MKEVVFDFSGKNFVVVGASSGMGRQVATELIESGANVLIVARNMKRLEEVKALASERVHIACLDVVSSSHEEWDKAFADFAAKVGKLNGGVYTAGITGCTPLKAYDENLAKSMMDISVAGGVKFMQHATRKKYADAGASYVIFSSVAAYEGPKGILFYAAAKGAVHSAVRVMSKEISHRGQRVNSVSPGWIQTEMTTTYLDSVGVDKEEIHTGPLGVGTPQDVSGMVLFLLSNRAKWITGQDFVIDGGYLNAR
ncbi:SDR family NAD(P)-dependent oxidoreductase [Selenomonas ruminantium]|uniref:NAD(P)-dependent dehydrogenase, short-chain alcohol dehydrogenase family n=1 Tax=Selenomonas ruminantium TaxID=971 RepID=A0A1H0S2S0_SELRU|nr:SDR family oxidoreductase [Selenomonas ruminantium]SDP35558.1 NAD(P)-dependent dehydrogenase, short-chain alcohol dehydrogenase family [Selenomonas ruminantium]